MLNRPIVVAVDGPAGSGKSSVCSGLAARLGWSYVNTGAIYRAVGLLAGEQGLNFEDETNVADAVGKIARDLVWNGGEAKLYHAGVDLTDRLNSAEASRNASLVARMPGVRSRLLELQRRLALQAEIGAIVDGRDIGTVIFPDADLKIFLTASLEERAKRRCQQLGQKDENVREIMDEIAARDHRDSGRGAAPLKQAEDAIIVDTTGLDLNGVIDKILQLMEEKRVT